MDKRVIEFIRTKDFKLIKEIGQGGTGKTVLLKDEIIDETFVCKKYSPYYEEHKELFFRNFVDEIKILHKIYHKNIVRVFNYYLYPEKKTGYILMEFIDGQNIKSYASENPHLINILFEQTINGFNYLEQNKILHRDIRPENILVSDGGVVKIIDFGFGKKINFEEDFDKSITLNWGFLPPDDFNSKFYDFRTEIYFVGKLFEEILIENQIEDFLHKEVLSKMIKKDFNERISGFALIERIILSGDKQEIDFTHEDKQTYKSFASSLISIFSKIEQRSSYYTDLDKIVTGLEDVFRNSILEDNIQNPNSIARCFVNGSYKYYKHVEFSLFILKDFIKLIKSVSIDKKRIILNNLWQRLDTVERFFDDKNDLPF
ncbi:MAG: serine/threonine protein kinase [Bacteroidetes bacterium GWF2_42_66]|nr:MAG: serine/threonine protein kinase [Bacteroidetes bacterium GWA2_42_15]OFY03574.1 MAG: serine/threonine protein kinase [Bacteroidetes bacterium GWE2_42_39]OFY45939.1 MAG: serine/threonine protein kinase [Bacteroidetes bacterium GWF2_42_66]HBL75181.1 serine/threonine protein kinase [Prolixibacteraceae bacterium]HCR89732.1 serine/threonine protein kinase [Prolixibacteraceae bacterium]